MDNLMIDVSSIILTRARYPMPRYQVDYMDEYQVGRESSEEGFSRIAFSLLPFPHLTSVLQGSAQGFTLLSLLLLSFSS